MNILTKSKKNFKEILQKFVDELRNIVREFRLNYEGWPRITEQTRIADRHRLLSTSSKSTSILWFISFLTRALTGVERRARYRHVCKTTFGTNMESTHAAHTCFKPSSCIKILRIDSCGMCRASARSRMVRCRFSLITAAPSTVQRLYASAESSNHLTFPSQMPLL